MHDGLAHIQQPRYPDHKLTALSGVCSAPTGIFLANRSSGYSQLLIESF